MAGTSPNVSRSNFDATKQYQTLLHQQGVVITDESLNTDRLSSLYARWAQNKAVVGVGRLPPVQIAPQQSVLGSANNFRFPRGDVMDSRGRYLKLYDGALARYEYKHSTVEDNYIVKGKCTAFDNGLKTMTNTSWSAIAALVFAGCKLRMTSGVNTGVEYTISTAVGSTFTFSGGPDLSAIVVGDEYVVLPPDLTTPGGNRTDDVVLLTWVEYLDEEEDADITDPTTQQNCYQAAQLRWCVRVDEGQLGIFSDSGDWLTGVSVMYIGTLDRTAVAAITSFGDSVAPEDVYYSLRGISDLGASPVFPALTDVGARLSSLEVAAVFPLNGAIARVGTLDDFVYLPYKIENSTYVHSLKLRLAATAFPVVHYTEMPSHDHGGATGNDMVNHKHGIDTAGNATITDPGDHSHGAAGSHFHVVKGPGGVLDLGIEADGDGSYTLGIELSAVDVAPNPLSYPYTSNESDHTHANAGAHVHTLGGTTEDQDLTHDHAITAQGVNPGEVPSTTQLGMVDTMRVWLDGVEVTAEFIAWLTGNGFPAATKLGNAGYAGDNAAIAQSGGVEFDLLNFGSAMLFKATGSHVLYMKAGTDHTGCQLTGFLKVN